MCTLSVSNVIYHKFSHGAAFYKLNGKNVNVMLEFLLKLDQTCLLIKLSQTNSKFDHIVQSALELLTLDH